ncbi:MAG: hypothetical protein ABSG53_32560 [Thermoguttaceae bacterium]|jgi:hypothetical protein
MPNPALNLDRTNPFCAARLRPGTIDFVFEQGKSLEQLVDALAAKAWRGQITGGHGTGKSTLLAALTPAVESRGRPVKSITLSARQRHLPRRFTRSLQRTAGRGVAAVDGVEQLPIWNRLLLKRFCQTRGVGLIVASHRSAHLPSLYETSVDEIRAWSVVQRLQDGFPPYIQIGDLVERLARHLGNLREALFDLYDLYEERSRV